MIRRMLPSREARAFAAWGAGAYAVVTGLLLVLARRRTGGRMLYVLDDAAIHLSMARTLVDHHTWGVEAGHYESASSSPVWTLLIAAVTALSPRAATVAPLVLNVLASLAVIVVLARSERTLCPGRRRPVDVAAVILLVVVVLFLPAATFLGMEHVLHLALLLAAVALLLRTSEPSGRMARAAPYLLLAVATLTRFETAFLAVGLGVGLVVTVDPSGPDRRADLVAALRKAAAVGLAVAVPLIGFALINHAMGQGWLPSSVVAKSDSLNGASRIPLPRDVMGRFTSDPMLAAVVGACAVVAVLGWRRRQRWLVAAVAVPVTALLHASFAKVGWYDRYQLYLIGLGVWTLLVASGDLLPAAGEERDRVPGPVGRPAPSLVPVLVLVLLLFSGRKVALTYEVPAGVEDTYLQRYQAARFLAQEYDGQPVATGELGYTSLLHDGPLTDLFGLGDREVLDMRIDTAPEDRPAEWRRLAEERGFGVVAAYPSTLGLTVPREWILVGSWTLDRQRVSAFEQTFAFWATSPDEVEPLIRRLRAFEDELPPGITPEINDLAEYRAAVLRDEAEGAGG